MEKENSPCQGYLLPFSLFLHSFNQQKAFILFAKLIFYLARHSCTEYQDAGRWDTEDVGPVPGALFKQRDKELYMCLSSMYDVVALAGPQRNAHVTAQP